MAAWKTCLNAWCLTWKLVNFKWEPKNPDGKSEKWPKNARKEPKLKNVWPFDVRFPNVSKVLEDGTARGRAIFANRGQTKNFLRTKKGGVAYPQATPTSDNQYFFPASVWILAKCSDISIFDSLIMTLTCSPYLAKVDRKKKLYWLQLDFLMLDYNVISFEYYDI